MAYSKGFTSLKEAMEEIYRDSGYEYVDWDDVVAWTFRLMERIGVPEQYITHTTTGRNGENSPVEISGYRGLLPSNIIQLDSCRRVVLGSDGIVVGSSPMIEATDVFFQDPSNMSNQSTTVSDPTFTTVILDEGEVTNVNLVQDHDVYSGGALSTYRIEGNVLFTNFISGYVEMVYQGFSIDSDGYPMFPADSKYLDAVIANVVWNLDRRRYRANPSPGNKAILNDSAQERAWNVGAAITKGRIPSIDQMESIKNSWLRSIPKINEHSNGFKTISSPEMRWTLNGKG